MTAWLALSPRCRVHDDHMAMTFRKRLKNGWTRVATGIRRRRRANRAIDFLQRQHRTGSWQCPHGMAWRQHCAHTVACAHGKVASGWDAYQGWEKTVDKYRRNGRNMGDPPRGALTFYKGGAAGYGHVAVSNGRQKIWTNDAPVTGKIGLVPLAYPRSQWQLQYVGWIWPDEVAGW